MMHPADWPQITLSQASHLVHTMILSLIETCGDFRDLLSDWGLRSLSHFVLENSVGVHKTGPMGERCRESSPSVGPPLGASINDVHKIFGFLTPLPLFTVPFTQLIITETISLD